VHLRRRFPAGAMETDYGVTRSDAPHAGKLSVFLRIRGRIMRGAMAKSTIAFLRPDDFRSAASFCHSIRVRLRFQRLRTREGDKKSRRH